jgi:hypothetical protein
LQHAAGGRIGSRLAHPPRITHRAVTASGVRL